MTADLDIGAELLDQPLNQGWALNLLLGAKMTESQGQEQMPVTERILIEFPKAKVNTHRFAQCRATDGQLQTQGYRACPSASQIGSGESHVRAIALPFTASLRIFNGRGTNNNRELIIYAFEPTTAVTVILRGRLRKINRGDFGFEFDLRIPPEGIQLLTDQFVSIEDFSVKVGKRIRKRVGKKRKRTQLISYIEAPRKCTGKGWPFKYRNFLKGGQVATDDKLIPCVIRAQ